MSQQIFELLVNATIETLYMVGLAGLLGTLMGLPLGVLLATSGRGELLQNLTFNRVAGLLVNATRSTPFIILVVAIIPFTRLIAGTSIGTTAAIVPLTVAAVPFIARLVEGSDPRGRSRPDRGRPHDGRHADADHHQDPAAGSAARASSWA